MKIIYVCEWNKIKERTWSGTTYFLYKSLKKKVDIQDVDIKLNLMQKLLSIKFSKWKIKNIGIFSPIRLFFYQRNINKKVKNSEDIVIQIGDYGVCANNTYVYQDLSIDSLIYFKKNKSKLFNFSGYEEISEIDMNKRRDVQVKFYENSKGIFTMAKWLSDNLINYTNIPKEKVHWIGAGINIDVNKIKSVNKNNNRILFVGRDFFRKGGDITYEAFKNLKENYMPYAELYIAGPKEWPLADKVDGVFFLGDISYSELSNYFNLCDIFCLPSRFEAYGLVFIEALVYGLPCIGRNEFEMKEFIQEGYNGYLVENDNLENLALKMYKLLNSSEIKSNVLKNRNKYIKEYSWDTVADRVINVIKEDCLKN